MLHLLKYVKYNENRQEDNENIEQILRIGQDEGYNCHLMTLSFSTHTVWLGNDSEDLLEPVLEKSPEDRLRIFQNIVTRLDPLIKITNYQIFGLREFSDKSTSLFVLAHGDNKWNYPGDNINIEEIINDMTIETESVRIYFDYYG
jgi:hypothetical protein